MRTLPPALAEHLASGATTLCHCWRLETAAGETMGFTDHDRDVSFDGLVYEAGAGFTASEIASSLGLAVDNLEASGALASDRLDAGRLRAGDFDDAAVEVWRVNWQDPVQRLLLRKGRLGEVRHGSLGFTAELRGLAHRLNQPRGRVYRFGCDASLGDGRCGVDLDTAQLRAAGTVIAGEEDRRFTVSGLAAFADDWFARGRLQWTGGANAGRGGAVKLQRRLGPDTAIELWQETAHPVAPGDGFVIDAGCDKQFDTCRAKFDNGLNFRGFPHIPGDDFAFGYARRDDPENDGDSRA